MLDYIGLPFSEACDRLKKENIPFETAETRSRKGIDSGREMVVRCQEKDGGCLLIWARFQTEP